MTLLPDDPQERRDGEAMPSREDEAAQQRTDQDVRDAMRRRTRRSFLVGGAAAAAAAAGYVWLNHARTVNGLQWPLRRAEDTNAAINRDLFRDAVLAPTYPRSRATPLQVNGDIGLDEAMILSSWRLQVIGLERPEKYGQFTPDVDAWDYRSTDDDDDDSETTDDQGASVKVESPVPLAGPATQQESRTPGLLLTMADLQKLPRIEMVTQFKCIEGWSQIVEWAGACYSDFLKAYPPARNPDGSLPRYVAMETSEGDFYSGYDLESLMHPQTLLCYEMGGQPLTPGHGAPLRLAMPLKYGYKQIKQIARITYTNQRPEDYWGNLGYDWYGGL